jgi:hypothetical protein
LWQVAQVPGTTPVCENDADHELVDLWQTSHACVVGRWFAGLPLAVVPLWQVAQLPGATPVWLKVAGSHAVIRWQASQLSVVGR